ncbi:MAG TPA: 30S ribosome-binding factor RbfA [Thiobacillus sp.]|nr:MAG: ribosome-binding factor A [Hydrogenophilales bacterium 28-61-11]OZA43507.1 MAG: ribosome-binding factor A [Hydrogenophilales bacterium 17-61-76]HQT71302.1 30S ribosome-binding factor RbfA [Thiobacillus sp.]
MPKDFPRARRVADQIQRELPELIRQEVKDPRVGMLTITEVEVNRDMEFAKVFFTTLGGQPEHDACLQGLQRASGFLRSQLSNRMQLRVVPKLTFVYDRSVEYGMQLSHLIEAAVAEDAKNAPPSPEEDDASVDPKPISE